MSGLRAVLLALPAIACAGRALPADAGASTADLQGFWLTAADAQSAEGLVVFASDGGVSWDPWYLVFQQGAVALTDQCTRYVAIGSEVQLAAGQTLSASRVVIAGNTLSFPWDPANDPPGLLGDLQQGFKVAHRGEALGGLRWNLVGNEPADDLLSLQLQIDYLDSAGAVLVSETRQLELHRKQGCP